VTRRLVGLLVGVLLLVPAPLTAATEDPGPQFGAPATPDVSDVPKEVAAWFAEVGPELAADADLTDEEEVVVGVPRQVATWAEDYLSGTDLGEPAQPVDQWVAPVLVQSVDTPEAVGAVLAGLPDGTGSRALDVIADEELGAALYGATAGTVFVYDADVEGWFAALDGKVWPVTEGARTLLHGPLAAEVFQEFLAVWHGEPVPTPAPPAADSADGGLSPLVPIVVILLLGAGAAWWLARQYRQADSRIVADVHAGIAPPREDEEAPRPPDDGPGREDGAA